MDVGIRELKAHLSEYVNRAAAGDCIRVTDRGVVRALLMPAPSYDRIAQGLAEGWISRAEPSPPVRSHPRATPPPGGATTTELLAEDRGD